MCAAGSPNWQKVGGDLIARNNELRTKLGLEPREGAVPNWQKIIDEVREENVEFADKLQDQEEAVANGPVKAKEPAKRVAVNKSKTTGNKED